ncbi:MAG: hypothetical protein ACRD1R_08070 [Acidobacteriota bacterium]
MGIFRREWGLAVAAWSFQGMSLAVARVRKPYLFKQGFAEGSLHKRSGKLFGSIGIVSRVLPSQDGFAVGTNVAYGIGWEQGFIRHGKFFAPRPFLAPGLKDVTLPLHKLAGRLTQKAIDTSFKDKKIVI